MKQRLDLERLDTVCKKEHIDVDQHDSNVLFESMVCSWKYWVFDVIWNYSGNVDHKALFCNMKQYLVLWNMYMGWHEAMWVFGSIEYLMLYDLMIGSIG